MRLRTWIILLFVFVLAACGDGGASDSGDTATDDAAESAESTITVSAAASLTDALNDIAELFNEVQPDVQVDYNFGGSGALIQQIQQGAPADLFLSANETHFDTAIEEGYIDEENSVDLLMNELVLVVPEGSDVVSSLDDLTNEGTEQIAIGTPESVPAGEYSVETFESMGIYEELESKFIYAEDVRQVLNYVETENVDAGLVYRTDALTSDSVEIVDAAPEDAHAPLVYPAGMLNETENEAAQQAFYDFIQGEEASEVFTDYGFNVQ